jgi:lysophospholipid acyltransferase (LPLAT)-like uncharacterized protein
MSLIGKDAYDRVREEGKPVVFLIWHSRIFLIPYFFRRSGTVALVSPSKDGEMMARVMKRWGYEIIRGSGSHPMASAWKAMKNSLLLGKEVIIVPDGPRGPNRKMKMGGFKLAKETGAVLVPWTYSARRKKVFDSWDRFVLFYPFSRIEVYYGQPVSLKQDITDEELEAERERMEHVLTSLEDEADRHFEKS